MPVGELFALSAAISHAIGSLIDKALTRRLPPMKQAALASLGGSLFSFVLMAVLGRYQELPDVHKLSLALGICGGLVSFGIGFTLFLMFLKSVDANKAIPLSGGISAILSVISGQFLLNEDLSALTLGGIVVILIGIYALSFFQRNETDLAQSVWLGFKGMAFLVIAASFWVTGFSMQAVALREVDAVILNSARLPAIFIFLTVLSFLGVGKLLRPRGAAAQIPPERIAFSEGFRARARGYVVPILNGSLNLGIGSLFILLAVEHAGLAVAFTLSNTSLLWLVLASPIFLRERLTLKTLAGALVTLAGVIMVVG